MSAQDIFNKELQRAIKKYPCLKKYKVQFTHCGRIKNYVGHCKTSLQLKLVIIKTCKQVGINDPYFVHNIRHELAHAIATIQFKRDMGHGHYWHNVAESLHCEPNLILNMDTKEIRYATNRYNIGR